MRSSEDRGVVATIVARVLGISTEDVSGANRDEREDWNSLKHIEIVFQVEEEFGVQFEEDDIPTLSDVDSIVSAVERTRGH